MSEPYRRQRPYPGKTHTLKDAADMGQLVVVRCNLCHRTATYLAVDLVQLLDPRREALAPPFSCSRCGKDEYLVVTLRLPREDDWGSLVVRRPGPVKWTQTWRGVKLRTEKA